MTQEGVFKAEDILELVQRTPFVPFRICMSDGCAHDIRHPELVLVYPRYVLVAEPSTRRQGLMEKLNHCSILHISRLEPLADAG